MYTRAGPVSVSPIASGKLEMMRRSRLILCCVFLALPWMTLFGCARTAAPPAGKTLYVRLGGHTMIASVVDEFVTNVLDDSCINNRFATADIVKLRGHLVDQLCALAGGPCVYVGRDMKAVHAGLKITDGEFVALLEDFAMSLDRLKVPSEEKTQLQALYISMRKSIVR